MVRGAVVEIQDRLPDFLNIAVSQKCIAHEDHIGEGLQAKRFPGITANFIQHIGKEKEDNV